MPIYVNILIIAVLFYFNAIFAMYEIAMVSAKKTRLQQRSEDGNQAPQLLLNCSTTQTKLTSLPFRL